MLYEFFLRAISILHRVGAALLTLVILLLSLRLYIPNSADYAFDRVGPDVLPQLHFIGTALRGGAGEQMQMLFPEGYFFTHALYGLAWVEVGLRQPAGDPLHAQALQEARWALEHLDSPDGKAPFSSTLDPPLGVFYVGWSSWLRGGVLKLQPADSRDPAEAAHFEADCAALAQAFDRSPTPFLNAYPSQAWPVDSVVAVAALRLHDTLLPPRFGPTIDRWLRLARARLDPATGLLPHRVDPATGQMQEGARGSSQSIIARFLVEIDPDWGREQYALFRRQFVAPLLGVPGVREYPIGKVGSGDVDSGPLLNGLSASATVVTLGAAQVVGDRSMADPLIHASEAVGLPMSWGDTKRYAFGLLPTGDAFLAWSKTARPWIAPPMASTLPPATGGWWRFPSHGLALGLLALIWSPVWIRQLWKSRARTSRQWQRPSLQAPT